MKNFKLKLFAYCLLSANMLGAQSYQPASKVFHANEIRTVFAAGGSMFWDGTDNGDYIVPYQDENSPGTIFNGNLWIGTIDSGQLRVAAQTFGVIGNQVDFYPGPLDPASGLPFSTDDVKHFNKVWSVERNEVEQHLADYADNGTIDNPIFSVVGWPGNRNPYFSSINGFKLPEMQAGAAPFFDRNGDGIYNAFQGEYPLPPGVAPDEIPAQMVWQVYNDAAGAHGETGGAPLGFEIQQTAWAFRCYDNPLLNQTLFVSHKIINHSGRDYSDVYIGQWSDLDIGCHLDDYSGCAPSLNSYFDYNATPVDKANCEGIQSYGEFPPVQAVTFLNQKMAGFQIMNNTINAPVPGTTDPSVGLEFYRSLTGKWKDGTPLTFGGDGYDPGSSSAAVKFAFPDDPNDPIGWSQYTENLPYFDVRQLGVVVFDSFRNGEVKTIDVAFSTHFDPKLNHVEQVSLIYDEVPKIKNWYATGFEGACTQPDCDGDCIWPGDANNDGIADHYDLLALGQGFGAEGPARYASKVWAPQSGGNWLQSLPSGLNFKHLDADGNGKVEPADFEMTKLHYGKFRNEYLKHDQYLAGEDFYFDTSVDLDDGVLDKSAGPFNLFISKLPMDSLVGVALTVEFDTNYFEDFPILKTSFLDYPNYAAAPRNEDNRMSGELNFAVVKNDGNSITENEKLFKALLMKPKAVLPSTSTSLRLRNIRGILQNGKEVAFGGKDLNIRFTGFEVKKIKLFEPILNIYPNPSDGVFYFHLDQDEVANLRILDAMGRLVDVRPKLYQRDFMVDLTDYSAGVYFMQLTRQTGVQTWILVKGK
ncbi:MAG: T9SS type A sorting domain-containing protein [Saprospiraceae bacterium]|nr:T9SS type A sorting domain-containing protein [Saprospiraceae bacterium]MCF8250418.1 T9SS type A sorting domain-containing protein [Saprospiraceae bacterium]MCF8280662.1 T9SS type A sorting domain-containing protein [Bacteroidales bacterium]MCF8312207.1 T9SS type A sorting domain-containing protein [Saprospiraceae bacterium]MCF8440548.1 T9SS type A sorting domain-containing protein [Saprospiraceae bacterium]